MAAGFRSLDGNGSASLSLQGLGGPENRPLGPPPPLLQLTVLLWTLDLGASSISGFEFHLFFFLPTKSLPHPPAPSLSWAPAGVTCIMDMSLRPEWPECVARFVSHLFPCSGASPLASSSAHPPPLQLASLTLSIVPALIPSSRSPCSTLFTAHSSALYTGPRTAHV